MPGFLPMGLYFYQPPLRDHNANTAIHHVDFPASSPQAIFLLKYISSALLYILTQISWGIILPRLAVCITFTFDILSPRLRTRDSALAIAIALRNALFHKNVYYGEIALKLPKMN